MMSKVNLGLGLFFVAFSCLGSEITIIYDLPSKDYDSAHIYFNAEGIKPSEYYMLNRDFTLDKQRGTAQLKKSKNGLFVISVVPEDLKKREYRRLRGYSFDELVASKNKWKMSELLSQGKDLLKNIHVTTEDGYRTVEFLQSK